MKSKFLYSVLFAGVAFGLAGGVVAQSKTAKTPKALTNATDSLAADLKYLSSDELKGRETGSAESRIARDYITKRFKESGVAAFKDGFFQEFSFEDRRKRKFNGANVIGFIKGKTKPDKYIVVTAHYDHLGVRKEKIYNGADDNASGTAALFAIAAYFKANQPEHSLIFAAFDAEEKGSPGAKKFLSAPPVKLSDMLVNINLDMVSRSDKNELYVAGFYHYPNLKRFVTPVAKKAAVKLLFGHDRPEMKSDDWTSQSDHRVFHKRKIPFIYFGVEDHKDYHKPTDDFENVTLRFYKDAVETIREVIVSVDKGMD
jgi:acetylornithine deacetylase/succinyl-diaminopimelate desuccinylase-like protein